eukprot:gene28074-33900_t
MTALHMSKASRSLQRMKDKTIGRQDLIALVEEDDIELPSREALDRLGAEIRPPVVGEIVHGRVLDMDEAGAWLEIDGAKTSAFLPLAEIALERVERAQDVLEVGQELDVEVVGRLRGLPVVSYRVTQLAASWERVFKLQAADEAFDVVVQDMNRGGAVCEIFGLQAFLPGSQIVGVVDNSLIGNTIKVKILDVLEQEGKLVLSQRRVLSDEQPALQKGAVLAGTVTGLRDYGLFVDLEGGLAGLLHISQISYERVEGGLERLFKVGQPVKVMVFDYDKRSGKIALSTKALEANAGDMLRDMETVFAHAEENAARFLERVESERRAREEQAKGIVAELETAIETEGSTDPLLSVAESIESILSSIISDAQP